MGTYLGFSSILGCSALNFRCLINSLVFGVITSIFGQVSFSDQYLENYENDNAAWSDCRARVIVR